MESFNAAATSHLTSIEIQPDGLVLRGSISVKPRPLMVAHFTETADGTAFTAFKSWIPAGTIERYTWTFEKEKSFLRR